MKAYWRTFYKIKVELKFGAGEGIRILDPLNLCLMASQKLKKYIESTLKVHWGLAFYILEQLPALTIKSFLIPSKTLSGEVDVVMNLPSSDILKCLKCLPKIELPLAELT